MQRNDEKGFFSWVTRLVRDHRGALATVARNEGLLADDALDAVQDAFATFLRLPHARKLAYEEDDSRNLLMILVRNHARNRRRRHELARPHLSDSAVIELLADDQTSVDSLIEEAEAHVLAFQCVEKLAMVQRQVVTLRLLEDLPGVRVADLLGTTPGHVAVILHRAKRELRACMAEESAQAARGSPSAG
ncbi:RNA polymerase sigma factor [Myxococcus landrumensis]|uniref:Sigma-70 family RNA polymerase sigma factor n=1 Tax=Myxococcus landrumensis TaxID=2813577 RepID=A0ABX7NCA8_9BACT|nr:sigma-70 family RNA polymerase sigma factor [Myxococcus landrumus]QSQ16048.1 sigma-70 family RNA polymerase sigma factor [Myxococcus landrumus]